MRPLPEYLNRNLPQCLRLTRVLAELDRDLFCVWNGRTQRYEVWGPSKSQGWAMLSAVEKPDGTPIHPDVYPTWILADLRSRRDQTPDARKLLEQNARQVEKAWDAAMEEAGEMTKYVAKAVLEEAHGALRFGADDVFRGLRAAYGGAL